MDKGFAVFGKIILAVIVLGGIAYGAYYFGTHSGKFLPQASPSPSASVSIPPSSGQAAVQASSAPQTKKVSAGSTSGVFSKYSIGVATGWTDSHTNDGTVDKLTITKGQYKITISQAAGGGGSCIFPGDTLQPLSQSFDNFVAINGSSAQFGRGTADGMTHTVCEKRSGSFGFPTELGYITYNTPSPASASVLAEMDGMISSITK